MKNTTTVRMLIAGAGAETGALLTQYLAELGVKHDPNAKLRVCYGIGTDNAPSLNAHCSSNKIERLIMMRGAGVDTVPWFAGDKVPKNFAFPALARCNYGHGGTDIVPVFQPDEVPWRVAAGWDWFSSYIPVRNEYRVWVFQGEHLDTYEKVMRRPADYLYIGRNFRNGFEFVKSDVYIPALVNEAARAIYALRLDFGAVDLVLGKDGRVYVLEVNTAPGVIRSGAQDTLRKLANKIAGWAKERQE